MKRSFAFILLLLHMNSSMFLPQAGGIDIVDTKGKQKDDINSVVEYISQILLGNKDTTPEDEDQQNGNSGQNFSYAKIIDYYHQPQLIKIEVPEINIQPEEKLSQVSPAFIELRTMDVLTPPPDLSIA